MGGSSSKRRISVDARPAVDSAASLHLRLQRTTRPSERPEGTLALGGRPRANRQSRRAGGGGGGGGGAAAADARFADEQNVRFRKHMEDEHTAVPNPADRRGSLYRGLYDGHGDRTP